MSKIMQLSRLFYYLSFVVLYSILLKLLMLRVQRKHHISDAWLFRTSAFFNVQAIIQQSRKHVALYDILIFKSNGLSLFEKFLFSFKIVDFFSILILHLTHFCQKNIVTLIYILYFGNKIFVLWSLNKIKQSFINVINFAKHQGV